MKYRQIIFPAINQAELVEKELPDELKPNEVLVRTLFTTVSPGTERANITGDPSVSGKRAPEVRFPRTCGYSSSGIVERVGDNVASVRPGDYVVAFNGDHASYNIRPENSVVKFDETKVSPEIASFLFISVFPLAAIRKTRVELGESALVMGCGLLGQLAVRQLRAAGAAPIIAADLMKERREDALIGGADYALDPTEEGFADKVKALTGGGANVCIEVTGRGEGLDTALDCMRRFGRVALLGCTRDKNFTIDYYRKVHFPGITLIGAHTNARPMQESHPGYFTSVDDIRSMLRLVEGGRMDLTTLRSETAKPEDCEAVFERLIRNTDFPPVMHFDWRA